MPTDEPTATSRRDLLKLIGLTAGSAALYQAMTSLGYAAESGYKGPIKLEGDPKGASVLILGAGLAGMVAALELRQAGYKVKVLEFNNRAGGRNWSLRGGDTYTELGGATQHCRFDAGLYVNPGPWRIPHHHQHLLHYCRELDVKAFGVNAVVMPPGYASGPHYHERQEELYLVHRGEIEFTFGDKDAVVLGPGGLARVDPATVRRVRNTSDSEEAVYLCVGGAGGYVGRDGRTVGEEAPR